MYLLFVKFLPLIAISEVKGASRRAIRICPPAARKGSHEHETLRHPR